MKDQQFKNHAALESVSSASSGIWLLLAILIAAPFLYSRLASRQGSPGIPQLKHGKTVELHFPFYPISGLPGGALAFAEDSKLNVWVATDHDIARFAKGDPRSFDFVLTENEIDRLTYSDFEKEQKRGLQTLASFAILPGEKIWAGTVAGDLLQFEKGSWKVRAQHRKPLGGPAQAIFERKGSVMIAGPGLWSWDEKHMRLDAFPDFKLGASEVASVPDGGVYFGDYRGVRVLENKKWQYIFETGQVDPDKPYYQGVTSLFSDRSNELLIGTHFGYFKKDLSNRAAPEKFLTGHWITGFARGKNGRLWVSTWESGLALVEGPNVYFADQSRGLKSNQVQGIFVDSRAQLWIGFFETGAVTGSEEQAALWMPGARTAIDPEDIREN